MREIQGKKKRDVYIYDEESMTVSDKEGNTIKLYVNLDDILEENIVWYLDILFHKLYKLSNEFKHECMCSKGDTTVWKELK